MRTFNSLLALLTWRDLTPGAPHRPLSRALATLVEREVQSAFRFNSLLALLTWRGLTPGAARRPLPEALAALVERGVQSAQLQQFNGVA